MVSFCDVHRAGTAVSVGSLRTNDSCGSGEFADLKKLADFCVLSGLSLIQLLPVNDTGTESSPYSALSAFALHPLYIRLQDVPGAASVSDDIALLKAETDGCIRFSYQEVRSRKLAILHKIYETWSQIDSVSQKLNDWIDRNQWVIPYSVYMSCKAKYNEASWKEWPQKDKHLSMAAINERWNDPDFSIIGHFYAWVQMILDSQFSDAAAYIAQKGILLKGDIPIMMNEDSCDAWAFPQFFRDDLRAGCPPDDFNPLGQNWGFPIYDWKNLEKDDYSWWKQRLTQAAKYYKAFRIDHVLGFFRIWAISSRDITGYSGWTMPSAPITVFELASLGFSGDRLRWISQAHVPTSAVQDALGGDYLGAHGILHTLLDRIGNEELWLFKPEIIGERDIYESNIPDSIKGVLAAWFRNRMLIPQKNGTYMVSWCFRDTQAWNSLLTKEQKAFLALQSAKSVAAEKLWELQARKILGALVSCTDMIPCAEDLGANPACVASVLQDLGIHSLRVLRWSRDWQVSGQPYYPVESYPELSVATPAVHDTSTIRGWWNQEGGRDELLALWANDLAVPALRKQLYSPAAAEFVLSHLAHAGSRFCVVQLQDLLDLDQSFYTMSADDERINRPGSVNAFNWTYRMPVQLELLITNTTLIGKIQSVMCIRSQKKTTRKRNLNE